MRSMPCCPYAGLPTDTLVPVKATLPDGTIQYAYMKQSVIDKIAKAIKETENAPKRKRSTRRSTKCPH